MNPLVEAIGTLLIKLLDKKVNKTPKQEELDEDKALFEAIKKGDGMTVGTIRDYKRLYKDRGGKDGKKE